MPVLAAGLRSGAERRRLGKYHPESLHRFMNHEVRPKLKSVVVTALNAAAAIFLNLALPLFLTITGSTLLEAG